MDAVLVVADPSNTYDTHRVDVERWSGHRVGSLPEIPAIVEGRV